MVGGRHQHDPGEYERRRRSLFWKTTAAAHALPKVRVVSALVIVAVSAMLSFASFLLLLLLLL